MRSFDLDSQNAYLGYVFGNNSNKICTCRS